LPHGAEKLCCIIRISMERPFPDLISWQNLDVCPRWDLNR
jgi:hypothetical protein